jgi:uncharacterized protein YdeI (YjbR/CyaY-like superfamily)
METHKNIPAVQAADRAEWRCWLEAHHRTETSVWLIIHRKNGDIPSVPYPEAVDEALCFGWIDSVPNKRDAGSYYQFFSKRNPASNWSRVNKEKVARLTEQGLMREAGLEMVELAKRTGTWTALDEVDSLTVPPDMQEGLDANPAAAAHWAGFPPSARRGILEWILNAKKPETRRKRIKETVALAERNIRANQYRP